MTIAAQETVLDKQSVVNLSVVPKGTAVRL